MALYENDFLVAEAHLSSRVSVKEISSVIRRLKISSRLQSPANIHPTEKHSLLTIHVDAAVMMQAVQGC